MWQLLRQALAILIVLAIITGLAYPLLTTVLAQLFFPAQANGSLLPNGQGSALIGQPFDDPAYFWGRLSATAPVPYNAAASSGSNLGPTNPALLDAVQARIGALHAANAAAGVPNDAQPPVDLVTASASGLDPHISLAAAEYQVARLAAVRGLDETHVRALVAQHTEDRQWGILGEPRVNVLTLNLALDALANAQSEGPDEP
jgi:K+-transporting ATPase ATPase C chain